MMTLIMAMITTAISMIGCLPTVGPSMRRCICVQRELWYINVWETLTTTTMVTCGVISCCFTCNNDDNYASAR